MQITLDQLSDQEVNLSNQYSFVYSFYENDSKDNTAEILFNWLKGKKGFLKSEERGDPNWGSLPFKKRSQFMANYRNEALDVLNQFQYDYLFIIDTDIVYESDFLFKLIDKLDSNPNFGMITPNTIQFVTDQFKSHSEYSYFDSWALIDNVGNQGISFSKNPFILPSDRLSWNNDLSVNVNSAFGGAALVRGDLIRKNNIKWNGQKGCEHWKFCETIRKLNYQVIVDPTIIAEAKHYKKVNINKFIVKYDSYRLRKNKIISSDKEYLIEKIFININIYFYLVIINIITYMQLMIKIISNFSIHCQRQFAKCFGIF